MVLIMSSAGGGGTGPAGTLTGNQTITGSLTVGGQILAPSGAIGSPGIVWAVDTDTGFYRPTANKIGMVAGGVERIRMGDDGLGIDSGIPLYFGTPGAGDVSLRRVAAGSLVIREAAPATANYGLFNLGSGPFDGATAGFFVGSASGTHLAINAASGFAGDLAHLQVAGVSKFKVDAAGAIKIGNTVNAVSPTAPNRTVTIDIAGTTYYLAAKTTND